MGAVLGIEVLDYYTKTEGFIKYPLRITGEHGEIWLSGWGFSGGEPHGTVEVLKALGYDEKYQQQALEQSSFRLGPPHKPDLDEPKPPPDWELSVEALDVLEAIQDLYEESSENPAERKIPTVRRISKRVGYNTSAGAQWRIEKLDKAGKLRRVKGRGIVWFEGMKEDE
jgi:hypothetical protein